ncbi:hypothetical protein LLG96_15130 [bacterium]|nr:hypothetical protein [bacterium]
MLLSMVLKQHFLQKRSFVFPKYNIKNHFSDFFVTFGKTHEEISEIENKLYHWYKEILETTKKLYVVCGELAFAWHYPDVVMSFERALQRGVTISMVTGPRIAYNEHNPEEPNPIVRLLDNKDYKLFIYLIYKEKFLSDNHFAISDNSVFLELPHQNDATPPAKFGQTIKNDSSIKNDMIAEFNSLLFSSMRKNVIRKIENSNVPDKYKFFITA